MKHEYDKTRRHAENTLAEVNRHLDRGHIKNPTHHHMLIDMAEKATRTLQNLDRMDADRQDADRPYTDTHIGYNARTRRGRTADDISDAVRAAMDVVDRILPRITTDYDDRYDVDDRQGVPGTGPYSNPRLRRRGGRKGIGRRRYEMDDRYDDDRYDDDRYDDDRYDDDRYDDVEARRGGSRRRDSRGRFVRSDYDRYDDARYDRADDRNRIYDMVARAAADTARRMADETRDIYPGTPVMPRYDRTRYDRTHETQDDRYRTRRSDAREDADNDTFDRSRQIGPGARE